MANTHILQSSHITQLSLNKIKSKAVLSHAYRHNTREKERLGESTGTHIDSRRTKFNDVGVASFGASYGKSIWQQIVSRITGHPICSPEDVERIAKKALCYSDGVKVRSDAVLAFEIEAGYPGDLMWHMIDSNGDAVAVPNESVIDEKSISTIEEGGMGYFLFPADMNEFREWYRRTAEFLNEQYGRENVLSIETHMDESKPHIHALITPSYVDEKGITRLSYKQIIGGKDGSLGNFRNLQTVYAEKFSDMGYSRGEKYSISKHYSDRDKVRAIAAKVLQAKLPEDRAEAEEAYKVALARKSELELELSRRRDKGKTVAKQIETIRILKEELAQSQQTIKHLQAEHLRRECELKGRKLYPDQKIVKCTYLPLQEQFVSDGARILEMERGNDVIDKLEYLYENIDNDIVEIE